MLSLSQLSLEQLISQGIQALFSVNSPAGHLLSTPSHHIGSLRVAVYVASSISLTNTLSHRMTASGSGHEYPRHVSSLFATSTWYFMASIILSWWSLYEFVKGRLQESTALLALYLCWIMITTAQGNVMLALDESGRDQSINTTSSQGQQASHETEEQPELVAHGNPLFAIWVLSLSSMGILGLTVFYHVSPIYHASSRSTTVLEKRLAKLLRIIAFKGSNYSWFFGTIYPIADPLIRKIWILVYMVATIPIVNMCLSMWSMLPSILVVENIIKLFPSVSRVPLLGGTREGNGSSREVQDRERNWAAYGYGWMIHSVILVFLFIVTAEQTAVFNRTVTKQADTS